MQLHTDNGSGIWGNGGKLVFKPGKSNPTAAKAADEIDVLFCK